MVFIVFGVYLAKAEVQEDQAHKGIAREANQDLQDGNTQNRKKNSQGRDPRTKERNSQGEDPRTLQVGTSVLTKYPARERTREPLKHQLKGCGSEKAERKEV